MTTVACILPTRDRRQLIPLAIASYLSQDWPAEDRELVVIDDGADPIHDLLQGIPNLVYLREAPGAMKNLSCKRNAAIRASHGDLICHFDDDDWSAPGRITDQVGRLLAHEGAEVSGYDSVLWWDPSARRASRYTHAGGYSWGPVICYTREYWQAHPWPERTFYCEDNQFLYHAWAAGSLVSSGAGDLVVLALTNPRPEAGHRDYWPFVPTRLLPAAFRQAAGIELEPDELGLCSEKHGWESL